MKECKLCKNVIENERLEVIPEAQECAKCIKTLEYTKKLDGITYPNIFVPNEGILDAQFVSVTFNKKKFYTYRIKKFCTTYNITIEDATDAIKNNLVFYIRGDVARAVKL